MPTQRSRSWLGPGTLSLGRRELTAGGNGKGTIEAEVAQVQDREAGVGSRPTGSYRQHRGIAAPPE
jgi:hypothetical protein